MEGARERSRRGVTMERRVVLSGPSVEILAAIINTGEWGMVRS